MDQPGTSFSDDPEICKLCNTQRRQYTCPKCEIPYCSLECYKSEAHLECSENFYKEWVETELKDRQHSSEDTKKIMDILKRMPTLDMEFGDDDEDDIEDFDMDKNLDGQMDSDDEEDVPDLAKRLETVDLNNADEVWSALTDAERQEFEASVRNGEAEKLLPLWSPWWSNSRVGTKLIQDLEDNKDTPDYVAQCPAIVDVPTFNELTKASPSVRFNLLNVLHAYAYMTLHCNGEHHNSPKESAAIFLQLSENMRQNKVFEDSASAIESVAAKARNCQSLPGDEEAMAAAKHAVNRIITGPEESNSSFYVSAALSDLHRLLSSARKESSSRQEKSIERIFSKRFHVSDPDNERLSRRTLELQFPPLEEPFAVSKYFKMKLTTALWRQHIGFMTKRHWWAQGKKLIRDTPAEKLLAAKGVNIVDATEVLKKPKKLEGVRVEVSRLYPRPPRMNHTHPDWNEKPCLAYGNNNLLLEGTDQAQLLIKAELIADALPERLEALEEQQSPEMDELIQRIIRASHIFDAHQEKLPKKRDPLKPEWNFPRIYGIPDSRKVHNLTQKLLQICEVKSDPMIVRQRKIVHGGQVGTFIEKGDDLLFFESTIDTMIMANKPLTPITMEKKLSLPFPDIDPLDPTIGLQEKHIYSLKDQYPVAADSPWKNVHTIFIHFDPEKVKNQTELPVTESQIRARSMIQSFGTAACCAKLKFGEETMDLPEPITVQCVQTNGQWFYFSVLQLNTLNINEIEGTTNMWWHSPKYDLFETAEYVDGIPTLEKYNPAVFKKILAFYRNV